ncbi:MAG: exodeoxyribonuclease VII small subunit [Gammaproteobacteria bacterium]|jgi:exodeoxyribonuclease VII small subunit|nr:exodeoxyribonuclease VII small subunit [Gammaproteobacteria bacterium]MBT5407188.1 exodeoxyribonuclease VII small subunit [Gammaproteobacteria bacterium]MBT5644631.1 exodeoxyribonuclease VII small subunit [Gammaproteobacteria bacterium]MBT5863890.1 exodeoxyribonuclease VII small subunit [Gammaproteobacteria bacterium]MBT6734093.1 exodeoxyribonuclease VII small subunit [Gammaproteobacteria bacterium]|tara:strand:+ start:529 stop:741 length:213 start_codon:yes stop_codon:yes gene_type:complete
MNKKLKSNLSTFEKDLKSMQLILEEIESKDLSLEEVIDKYKLGVELSKKCQKALEEAEQKIKQVTDDIEK